MRVWADRTHGVDESRSRGDLTLSASAAINHCSCLFADYYWFSAAAFSLPENDTQTLPRLDGLNGDVMSTSTLQPNRIPNECCSPFRLMRALDRLLRHSSSEKEDHIW